MPIIQPAVALSTRQEAFCRHYAASGNAADAARQAGYSGRSARQTGCALLERPYIVERVRRSRLEREERGGGEDGDWSGPATSVSPRTMTKHDTS